MPKTYEHLVDRLVAAEPACGYSDSSQLPDISVSDVCAVLRKEPRILDAVRLSAEAITQAMELPDLERSAMRMALHLRQSVETEARSFLFCDVIDRCSRRVAA